MILTNLQGVAELVIREAQRQGYIVPRQIRGVLSGAGVSESLWRDVISVARPSLSYRNGRYYYRVPVSERVRQEQTQQIVIQKAVHEIIRHYRKAARVERRDEERIDFVQTVKVRAEDGSECTMLTRDISSTGIRLIATRRFLGQKIHVSIPVQEGGDIRVFVVRILWTCTVGADLIENGGTFLEVTSNGSDERIS